MLSPSGRRMGNAGPDVFSVDPARLPRSCDYLVAILWIAALRCERLKNMTQTAPHAYSPIDMAGLAQELLAEARDPASRSGRAARTLVGGRDATLRQTLIALTANAKLNDHESPGEATLCVLEGEVSLTVGEHGSRVRAGEIMEIPMMRHGLIAHEDSVVLLSVSAHTRPATGN